MSTLPLNFLKYQKLSSDAPMFTFATVFILSAAEDLSCKSSGIPASVGRMCRALASSIAFCWFWLMATPSLEITIPEG